MTTDQDIARLRAEVARLGGELEVYERHFERFRVDLAKAIRERDAVCRYAAGFLTGKPEQILENALTVAGYVLSPLRPPGADPPVAKAIACPRCGAGELVELPLGVIGLRCTRCGYASHGGQGSASEGDPHDA